jgi:hypothetical protein
MKRQMIILAAVVTPLAFFSYSKEKVETQPTNDSESISGACRPWFWFEKKQ